MIELETSIRRNLQKTTFEDKIEGRGLTVEGTRRRERLVKMLGKSARIDVSFCEVTKCMALTKAK